MFKKNKVNKTKEENIIINNNEDNKKEINDNKPKHKIITITKSTINEVSPLPEGKQLIIKQLFANPNSLKMHEQKLRNLFKNDSDDIINTKIKNIVIRENVFNAAMDQVEKCFKFDINHNELENIKDLLSNNFPKDIPDKDLTSIAEKFIKKNLIYTFLTKKWEIKISDDVVKNHLDNFYTITNQPIRQILDNKEEFENIRKQITEEQITKKILACFEVKIDLEKKQEDTVSNGIKIENITDN